MEIVVQKGSTIDINQNNLTNSQKPDYLNLKVKVRLVELLGNNVQAQLINDAINHIDFCPFIKIENEDQKLLLINLIKYQMMIRGIDISGFVQDELMKLL